ncbi:MAG: diguanylate cyclase domain-containing protein, partial [Kineosporiaceae bacterium]
ATPPPPTLLRPGPRPLVLSAGDDPAGDRFLRGRGAVAAASCAVPQQGSETVLVATSDEPPDETVAELLRLLAHAAGAGLRNAALLAEVSRARAEAEHRSNHDMLTGLLNRAAFHRLLAERCAEVAQAPDGRRDHLLFCDLDGFKAVNDELGHEAGDSVLRVFAQRLRDCLGSEATVARLGGDEFTALLPGDEPDPGGRCERLLREAAQPIGVAGGTARVGTSIGVALLTDDPDESLRRADAAMYEAKSAGKGRWQLWRAGPGIPVQSPPDVAAHARRARRGQPAGADP